MTRLTVILTALCNLALAGHFLRDGTMVGVVLCLAVTVTLWSRRQWAVLLNALTLLAGAPLWLATAGQILAKREAAGQPYQRMLVILGCVAALSAATGLLWAWPKVRSGWVRAPAPEQ